MFSLRRRWPIATAAAAALFYGANNFTISGLENLQVAPIDRSGMPLERSAGGAASTAPGSFGFDLTQFGINTSAPLSGGHDYALDPYGLQANSSEPAWQNALTRGEKLALWQDKMQRGSADSSSAITPGLPIASPIPIPSGLTTSPRGLPSTAASSSLGANGATSNLFPAAAAATHGPSQSTLPGTMTSLLPSSNVGPVVGPLAGSTASAGASIRLASFHVPALGPAMLSKPHVVQSLVTILRQYDLIALQGIQTSRDDVLPLIIDKLNQSGRSYDFIIGPRVGRTAPHQQFAFVFDTSRLETDRYQLYTIDDPEDLMNYEPLVAWFRCKGVPVQQAFTFSLVNVSVDPSFADAERAMLPQLIEAIEQDGRREDDWILAGDFAGGNAQLSLLDPSSVRFAISDIPTDVAGTQMLDLILFSSRGTTEFTGRSGAFDFLRKYNLSIERALEISSHLPIWAEFSSLEGAQPGRIAPASDSGVL